MAVVVLLGVSTRSSAQSDDCTGATPVVTGTNAGGNNCGVVNPDDAEAACQANSGLDVWYVWTADCTGGVTIDTDGSNFAAVNDTVLSVYEGACGGSEIACSDDRSEDLLSEVSFACTIGTPYFIRVAGYDTGTAIRCGDIVLNITCTEPPAGDICADAVPVGAGTTIVSNAGSALDDPDPSCVTSGAADVWAVYTVETNGSVLIDTCGTYNDAGNPTNIDTILAVYSGGCGGAELDCDDDCTTGSTIPDPTEALCVDAPQTSGGFTRDSCVCIDNVTAGQALYIQIQDFGGTDTGNITLNITPNACQLPTGRCCQADGNCTIVTQIECDNAGGIFGGANTDCTVSCFGACCLSGGNCQSLTETDCDALNGVYQGDGAACSPNPCPLPPTNDTCDTASHIGCETGTIGGLTLDLAAPDYSMTSAASCTGFTADGPDIVFSYTATADGNVHAGMANVSGFDASFYVVTDCFDPAGSCVAGDDSGGVEEVTFVATAGTTYYLVADSYSESPDPGTLFDFFIECPTICNSCPGDVNGDSKLDGRDIQQFATCFLSEFGTAPSAACKCADVEDDNVIDALDIPAFVDVILNGGGICNAGRCCYLDAGSTACAATDEATCNAIGGDFTPNADCATDPCPMPPTHDACDSATVIVSLPFADLGVDFANATDDSNANPSCDSSFSCTTSANNGIWYRYTPEADCDATIGVAGADTVTSLWTGFDCNSLTEVICSDPQTLNTSLTAGTTYWILVSNYSCSSEPSSLLDIMIDCEMPPPPPANDACINAIPAFTGTNSGVNTCGASTVNDAEASCQDMTGKDVFYVWTADCTGTATIDTEGSMFEAANDTVLTVFDACGGSEIACDDDGSTGSDTLLSVVSFNCVADTDYVIRVAGYNALGSIRCGDVTLNIACAP